MRLGRRSIAALFAAGMAGGCAGLPKIPPSLSSVFSAPSDVSSHLGPRQRPSKPLSPALIERSDDPQEGWFKQSFGFVPTPLARPDLFPLNPVSQVLRDNMLGFHAFAEKFNRTLALQNFDGKRFPQNAGLMRMFSLGRFYSDTFSQVFRTDSDLYKTALAILEGRYDGDAQDLSAFLQAAAQDAAMQEMNSVDLILTIMLSLNSSIQFSDAQVQSMRAKLESDPHYYESINRHFTNITLLAAFLGPGSAGFILSEEAALTEVFVAFFKDMGLPFTHVNPKTIPAWDI